MRAVVFEKPLPVDDPACLLDVEVPTPEAAGRDLLVLVKAIAVNPVDFKVRRSRIGEPRILGFDAAGVVVAVGSEARHFAPGEEVWYAGAINRPGTNSEFHLVDERIVGHKPKSIDFPASAALPLTSLTAWEAMFERLDVRRPVPGAANTILVIGGAGGVGSVAIQLARRLTDLTVIATASRPETIAWCLDLGAHHVVDHTGDLVKQVEALGVGAPAFVFSTTHGDQHFDAVTDIIAPQGRIAVIDTLAGVDMNKLMRKSVSVHWELMFTRAIFQTADMEKQHATLDELSRLVDAGIVRTTLTENFGTINAANLKRAHALLEGGRVRGKIVLEGW